MIDQVDKEILRFVQGDLPCESRPYESLSSRLGISETEICDRLQSLHSDGLIRRFGAILRHAEAGYRANAMVVWKICVSDIDNAASILASNDAVSHLYARRTIETWPFNIYSMVHARDDAELSETIGGIAEKLDGMYVEYRVLKSVREFKKSSMKYFQED